MINTTKPTSRWLLSLALIFGLSGCLFHHRSKNTDADSDNDNGGGAETAPAAHRSGAHKMPRNRASDLADMLRNPSRHQGQYVSSYGPVRSITPRGNGATEFQITTPNYAYLFIVDFPGEIPNLEQNRDTYFLGTFRGIQAVGEVPALLVDAIAIQTTGGRGMNPYSWPKAIYLPGQEEVTSSWLSGNLDLTGGVVAPAQRYAEMAAPRPAPNYYAAPAQPTYAQPTYAQPAYVPPPAYAPAAPAAPAPAWQGGGANSMEGASLIKIVQNWNSLPPEAKERILGIVSEYSR